MSARTPRAYEELVPKEAGQLLGDRLYTEEDPHQLHCRVGLGASERIVDALHM